MSRKAVSARFVLVLVSVLALFALAGGISAQDDPVGELTLGARQRY